MKYAHAWISWLVVAACFNPGGGGSSTDNGEPASTSTTQAPTTTTITGGATESTSASTTTSGSTTGTAVSTGEDSTTAGAETAMVGTCGDGTVDAGEACDDGDIDDDNECSNTCGKAVRYMFVTADVYFADEAAPPTADGICNALGATRFPGRMFIAWSSTVGSPIKDRLGDPDLPFVLPDGSPVAENRATLLTGAPQHAIDMLIDGTTVTAVGEACVDDRGVWTGTADDGTATGDHNCANWSNNTDALDAVVGDFASIGSLWTGGCITPCVQKHRLYCIDAVAF